MRTDVASLKAEVTHLKTTLDSWTKEMEKNVNEHNKEFDNKMSELQVNGTMQLSVLEKKFEDQFAAMMTAINDLTNHMTNIASGPPPPPTSTPAAAADPWAHCGPHRGNARGGR